jgi:IclR family transcriptional regulator, acetate operon repressor
MTLIRSVTRVSEILGHVATQPLGATAKEIAQSLKLPLPTAYHLLGTLVAEGLLTKDSQRRYQLGPQLGVLTDAYARQFTPADHLVAPLYRLAAATGETAYVATWRNDRIAVLASVEGRNAVRVSGVHIGVVEQAHARASGKLLLAFAPERVRHAYLLAFPLTRVTSRTIVDRDAFDRTLDDVRRDGFAVDEEEFREGVACAAAPVLDNGAIAAAYSLSAPAEIFRRTRESLIAHLCDAAAEAGRGSNNHRALSPS